jgi:4-methylaminobutanoate oxidase (formaldehyde-forming)
MEYVRNPEGVTEEYALAGTYELVVATERVPCIVKLKLL